MKMAFTTQVRHNFGFYNIFWRVDSKMLVKLYLLCVLGIYVSESMDYCKGHFENCICTDTNVTCHNEVKLKHDITKLFHYIKDDVIDITITGCNLKELPQNTFGSCRQDTSLVLHKLKKVDLSNNSISTIHGKSFHCAPKLETLILSNNAWQVDRGPNKTGYFTSIESLKHLDLTNTFEEVWDGYLHITKLARVFNETDMTSLETLKLGYNEFFSFSVSAANSFCQLTSLKTLDLSHNNLEDPSLPTKPDCLENLEKLDFSYNRMTVLPQEFMDKLENLHNLTEVKLDNNPYSCDCGLIQTWKWLNATKVTILNKKELKCASGYHSSYTNIPILSLSLSDLKCEMLGPPSNTAVKVVTGIIFAVVGLTLIAFLVVHREKVKLVCKKWKKRVPNMRFRSHQGYASVQEVAVI
ncbi:trophoblast glycoprotein-like [Mercenaria mercenaria]|uniref:trophoblast glycoprotein-like n=1 Tax=Mercenaria mercenaria TaxID=6596 RepID=UPI00234E5947|nr:trophoblast glycoprotein-like [Mercenaria mercenaria]